MSGNVENACNQAAAINISETIRACCKLGENHKASETEICKYLNNSKSNQNNNEEKPILWTKEQVRNWLLANKKLFQRDSKHFWYYVGGGKKTNLATLKKFVYKDLLQEQQVLEKEKQPVLTTLTATTTGTIRPPILGYAEHKIHKEVKQHILSLLQTRNLKSARAIDIFNEFKIHPEFNFVFLEDIERTLKILETERMICRDQFETQKYHQVPPRLDDPVWWCLNPQFFPERTEILKEKLLRLPLLKYDEVTVEELCQDLLQPENKINSDGIAAEEENYYSCMEVNWALSELLKVDQVCQLFVDDDTDHPEIRWMKTPESLYFLILTEKISNFFIQNQHNPNHGYTTSDFIKLFSAKPNIVTKILYTLVEQGKLETTHQGQFRLFTTTNTTLS